MNSDNNDTEAPVHDILPPLSDNLLQDIVEERRRQGNPDIDEMQSMAAELLELRAERAAVLRLHYYVGPPSLDTGACACGKDWPCDTVKIFEGAL